MPFDRETGKPTISFGDGEDYTSITAEYIMQKAKSDSEFLVITPAMPGSAGLNQEQRKELGLQYVDVGIAEEQAVAMALGLVCYFVVTHLDLNLIMTKQKTVRNRLWLLTQPLFKERMTRFLMMYVLTIVLLRFS